MNSQKTPQDEDIDLGSVFKIIGKGIRNIIDSIGQFFKFLFHCFIVLLLFLRNNAVKLGISMVVGAAVGFYFDFNKEKIYTSTMLVEPNFKSTRQLYQNINFYNELVRQEDSVLLAKSLSIDVSQAKDLKGFYITPIENENEKYEFFNEFVENLDTTTVKNLDIRDFKKGFTMYDYRYHQILVKSLNSTIFKKIEAPIINSIENNTYFKTQKKIHDQNLQQNETVLLKSLVEVDTLRRIYNEVMITEAKKSDAGTSITLAQGAKKTNEIELFTESLKLNKELIDNNTKKAETSDIINIVSSFSEVGIKERDLFKKFTVQYGLLGGLLMLFFILLGQLNKYLVNYKIDK
ncbi:hypothetical protein MWU59_01900 [Flavobacteriaceae bacterium F08102]|nr:hypothetical protein [Flavobacteriaceae bacterium F08102]